MSKKIKGKEAESGWEEIGMEGWIQCKSCHLHILLEDAESMGCPRCGQIYYKKAGDEKAKEEKRSNLEEESLVLPPLALFQLFSQNSGPDPAPVLDFLYLGSMIGVGQKDKLERLEKHFREKKKCTKEGSIIHILNMAEEVENKYPNVYDYKNYLLEDVEDENILVHLEETSKWIAQLKAANELVIVHCAAGVSRSATVVIAYLIKYENMSLREAYDFVKKKRKVIAPNSGFLKQLMEFEKQIHGKASVSAITELDPRALEICG